MGIKQINASAFKVPASKSLFKFLLTEKSPHSFITLLWEQCWPLLLSWGWWGNIICGLMRKYLLIVCKTIIMQPRAVVTGKYLVSSVPITIHHVFTDQRMSQDIIKGGSSLIIKARTQVRINHILTSRIQENEDLIWKFLQLKG